jgi:hypothetical protein
VWIDHSLAFRSRERLFIPAERWEKERNSYYRRLSLPKRAESYLEPLIERAQAGVAAVANAVEAGDLKVDDELHLTPLAAEEEEPELVKLRAALDHRIGEAQLPDLLLQVDAKTRFSWIMLGREPRSDKELLMVYGGILAHGTSMSAAETARMIPQLSATTIRQTMRWAGDERRLAEASAAVLAYMRQHPIAATWGRSDLASSDMMSLETQQRIWQARIDPRRQTPSVGIYSHVLAGWGIFNAQPFVLNERQVGVAIEGVLRQKAVKITQLAVDTHGRHGRVQRRRICDVSSIEGALGSPPVYTPRLRGARDPQADLRGQLGLEPSADPLGPVGPSAGLRLQWSHQRRQRDGPLWLRRTWGSAL